MKFNHKDWDIETGTQTGNDDFIYGNYVEWDKFRNEKEEKLLECFGIILPWDKEITLSKYIEVISQDVFINTSIINDYLKRNITFKNNDNLLYEIIIKFPSRNSEFSDKLISKIFDYYEVPSGTQYEYELPEDLQYWNNSYEENEYQNYIDYPLKFEEYPQTIKDIKLKIERANDNLTKKALILASFSITESLYKNIIVKEIPKENKISNFSQKILDDEINKLLRGSNENKNKLFKSLLNKVPPKQPWLDLRNSLAHDIEDAKVDENKIEFTNLKSGEKETKIIEEILKQQVDFYDQLKMILDAHHDKK
ncbi:hypothetical protein [Exercitatus varius]|uniref:hypothetical protein n=1 Tax=Exercitatus varius TaxID=67857 RepID=UPI00294AFC7B|nr:hypothetical protein [Exercitatus varius]MDG2958811.1 hypothetical protein [Exercitatus varius]